MTAHKSPMKGVTSSGSLNWFITKPLHWMQFNMILN
jgi:hypothetical protein